MLARAPLPRGGGGGRDVGLWLPLPHGPFKEGLGLAGPCANFKSPSLPGFPQLRYRGEETEAQAQLQQRGPLGSGVEDQARTVVSAGERVEWLGCWPGTRV